MNEIFGEIFEALSPSYQSVEVRAFLVAIGEGEGWRSASTVIRLSHDPYEQIESQHQKLVLAQRIPKEMLDTQLGRQHHLDAFRGMNVELSAYPIGEFWNLFRRFDLGIIDCRKRAFHVWDDPDLGIDLRKERVTRRFDAYATDDGPWEVYYLGRGQLTNRLIGTPDSGGNRASVDEPNLDGWARMAGQPSYRAMFERVLGVPHGQGEKLEIRAPIYACIDEIQASNGTVRVVGRYHSSLGQLSVECSFYRIGTQGYRVLLLSTPVSLEIAPNAGGLKASSFSEEFTLSSNPEMGSAEATVYKMAPMRVDLYEKRSRLRSGVPSYKTFSAFVPDEDISALLSILVAGTDIIDCRLFNSVVARDGSNKLEELIEYLTLNLMALCGLSPIWLSPLKHDVLSGGLSAGSADILATTREGDPILVSCTMAMPDSSKAGMLGPARTAICSRYQLQEERMKMVLVTGKPSVTEQYSDIKVLAAKDLSEVWEALQVGNVVAARHLLGV